MVIRADLCVIGAGSAALAVAAGAARMGVRVVLVGGADAGAGAEHDDLLAQALLAAGKTVQACRRPCLGSPGQEQVIDHAAIMQHPRAGLPAIDLIERVVPLQRLGVRVILEPGGFVGPRALRAGDHMIRARRFVIATGAAPALPALPGLGAVPFLTLATLPGLRERPGHLLILGAGRSGLAMAQAHRRRGSQVTLIDTAQALGDEDPQAVALVGQVLRGEGVEIIERATPELVGGRPGAIELRVAGGTVFIGTHLLLATGRRPDLTGLGLDAAGIDHGPDGVQTDAGLRSSNRRVLVIGDAAGPGQRRHCLAHQVRIVLRALLPAFPARLQDAAIVRVTHTDPVLARAGLSEAEARARHGGALQVMTLPPDRNDTGLAPPGGDEAAHGLVKLVAHRDRLLGVTIVSPGADRMIDIWALALARRTRLSAVLPPAGTVLPDLARAALLKGAVDPYFSSAVFDNKLVKRVFGLVQRVLP